jgi:hypothetical protein
MAVTSVRQPFPPFGDVDGNPLENGYIYIGVIDLDPVANPIDVYWDADLTVPVVQPIRTIGGYPSNNGTPGALFAVDEYSITIKNKNSTLVATSPAPTVEISVATSTKIGGVKSGGGISVDPVGAVTIVNDSHTHDTQYYPIADIDTAVATRRQLYAKEAVTHNIAVNADYTLTADQNLYGRVIITDTGVVLTAGINITVDNSERDFIVQNDTLQSLNVKTALGTGIEVPIGGKISLLCDGSDVIEPFNNGLIIQQDYFKTGTFAQGTTVIPSDNTIPQITEGTQFMSLAFTPLRATSVLKIDVVLCGQLNIDAMWSASLYKDADVDSIGSGITRPTPTGPDIMSFSVQIPATDLTTKTFTVRAGASGGTFSFNANSAGAIYGGALASSITITEIAQ